MEKVIVVSGFGESSRYIFADKMLVTRKGELQSLFETSFLQRESVQLKYRSSQLAFTTSNLYDLTKSKSLYYPLVSFGSVRLKNALDKSQYSYRTAEKTVNMLDKHTTRSLLASTSTTSITKTVQLFDVYYDVPPIGTVTGSVRAAHFICNMNNWFAIDLDMEGTLFIENLPDFMIFQDRRVSGVPNRAGVFEMNILSDENISIILKIEVPPLNRFM